MRTSGVLGLWFAGSHKLQLSLHGTQLLLELEVVRWATVRDRRQGCRNIGQSPHQQHHLCADEHQICGRGCRRSTLEALAHNAVGICKLSDANQRLGGIDSKQGTIRSTGTPLMASSIPAMATSAARSICPSSISAKERLVRAATNSSAPP